MLDEVQPGCAWPTQHMSQIHPVIEGGTCSGKLVTLEIQATWGHQQHMPFAIAVCCAVRAHFESNFKSCRGASIKDFEPKALCSVLVESEAGIS